jgi:hypothetical protein
MNLKHIFSRLYIVASLILVAYLGWAAYFREQEVIHDIQTTTIQRTDSIRHYKDAAGREHVQRVLAEAGSKAIGTVYRREIDSIKAALNIKEKQLQAFTLAATVNQGYVPLKVDTVYIDSAATYNFAYNDRWLDVSGSVGKNSFLKYKMTGSLVFTTYWKRKWLLGRKTTYIDAYSHNPHVRVTGLDGARISIKEPGRFGVGPYIGLGWTGSSWVPSIGLSLHYSIIRF